MGILSEALHSALDLVAAVITFFAVKFSDTPPDEDHNFGHGKIENYSALIETLLLVITCVWIIYEAIRRLVTHEVQIEVNVWSFIVIITSIVIDFSVHVRVQSVKKHDSQRARSRCTAFFY